MTAETHPIDAVVALSIYRPMGAILLTNAILIQRSSEATTPQRAHWYGVELPKAANKRSHALIFTNCAYPPCAHKIRKCVYLDRDMLSFRARKSAAKSMFAAI
ncbi:hypothetical protein N2603_27895 [Bradyrhizobium huanghuaihaiense]|uniref:hypothetical protein n=1 Tax=Bradyrhizobium huanghuaihaiense TaxID=990078 RepID=UPI0021A97B63|nr:hypothetical protein [Bradyrhizobium sp. CB3035]UWU73889.1 hypothetical protein N2603_27895 [Bradyrhizobium sp. CB3035]